MQNPHINIQNNYSTYSRDFPQFSWVKQKSGSASFKMHSRKNLSFMFVASGFSLLLCLLRFFATAQTFTDGACFRVLMEQICHIPFAVVHYINKERSRLKSLTALFQLLARNLFLKTIINCPKIKGKQPC